MFHHASIGPIIREYDFLILSSTASADLPLDLLECLDRGLKHNVRWAIASTNMQELLQFKASKEEKCRFPIRILEADPADFVSLTEKTLLLVNYSDFHLSESLIASCIETQTTYVDLDRNPNHISTLVEKFGQLAQERGVTILPSCAPEQLLSDLAFLSAKNIILPGQICSCDTFVETSGETWAQVPNPLAIRPQYNDLVQKWTFPDALHFLEADYNPHIHIQSWRAIPSLSDLFKVFILSTLEKSFGTTVQSVIWSIGKFIRELFSYLWTPVWFIWIILTLLWLIFNSFWSDEFEPSHNPFGTLNPEESTGSGLTVTVIADGSASPHTATSMINAACHSRVRVEVIGPADLSYQKTCYLVFALAISFLRETIISNSAQLRGGVSTYSSIIGSNFIQKLCEIGFQVNQRRSINNNDDD